MGFFAETMYYQIGLGTSVYSPSISFKERLFLEMSFVVSSQQDLIHIEYIVE
jgi:hypothetical protein